MNYIGLQEPKHLLRFNSFLYLFFIMHVYGQAQIGGPTGTGQWSAVQQMPLVPVAAANLPNGKILTWSAYDRFAFGGNRGRTYTAIFDPATNASQQLLISNTQHDMFCPGTSSLEDGRIMVTGGSSSNRTSIYDPFTEQWTTGASMNISRGYHAMVTLGDGRIYTIGGSWSGGRGNKHAEIYDQGTWTLQSGVPVSVILDGTSDPQGDYVNDNHAWLWPAPDGKIFHAGPSYNMHWIDPTGNGSYSNVGRRGNDDFAYGGIAVMFDVGKILKAGGATTHNGRGITPSSSNSYVIDINTPQVLVTQVQNLQYARTKHNGVVLPTGEVMVIGGIATDLVFNDTGSLLTPELWSPSTQQWRSLAPMQTPRNYHSIALLLPDGRVMAGGGGLCGNCTANHPNIEIFSPPYLFDTNGNLATRPVITNAPQQALPNSNPTITTSEPVSYFSLIRYNSVTHSTNNEQRRFQVLATDLGNNQYQLSVPNNNIAIPGYYMLFAINAAGTPSVAHVLQVPYNAGTPIANFTASPLTGVAPLPVSFDASTSLDDQGIVSYSWDFGDGNSGTGLQASHTYTQAGIYEVTLTVRDAQSNQDTKTHTISVSSDIGPGGTISTLTLWLKADAGVSGTTAISAWADARGLGFHATQNTPASQPTKLEAEINFNPALDFDGTNDRLQTQLSINHADLPQASIIAIYQADNTLSGSVWGEDNYGWDRFLLDDKRNRAQLNHMVSDGQGGNHNIPGLYPVNEPVLTTVVYNQGTSNASSVHVNGENVRIFTANQAGSSNPLQIGDDGNGIQSFNGKISELIVFDEVLSDIDREKVQSYLGLKYGISLDHSYYASDYEGAGAGTKGQATWDKTINTGYGNQVTGIGRDDKSDLDQRQAKNEAAGSLIEIYHGPIASTFPSSNAANNNPFPTDKSFLIFGNNAASVASLNKDILGGSQQAVSRVWKVQETASVGTVSLRVPKAALPSGTNFLYVNNSDTDFPNNSGTMKIPLVDEGGTYWVAAYDFADGDYFTFGSGVPSSNYTFSLKAFLEGSFDNNSGLMDDYYRTYGLLGNTDPYGLGVSVNPGLLGDQGANSIQDWIKIELRDANDPSLIIAQTAGLIKRNGNLVDKNEAANITFENLSSSSFYVCIKHYNHLGVMTAQAVDLSAQPFIDFSNPSTLVYSLGGPAMRNLSGRMLLWGGDANGDGSINALDLNLYWRPQNGQAFSYGSSNADFDLNALINSLDLNFVWRINNSLVEQIP